MRNNNKVQVQVAAQAGTNTTDDVSATTPATTIDSGQANKSATATGTSMRIVSPAQPAEKPYALLAKRGFSEKFVAGLVAQIKAEAPKLKRDHDSTLRQVCGPEYWLQMTRQQMIDAGRCVPALCNAGVVPLIDTGRKNDANARLYRVK